MQRRTFLASALTVLCEYIATWKQLEPAGEEVLRNFPVRQPLWF